MKKLKPLLHGLLVLFAASACAAQPAGEPLIVTSVAPIHQLVLSLTEGTGIRVENIPARARSLGSQPTFFQRQSDGFRDTLESADAAVGISRVWPEDPLYLFARQANIRVVPVDAALPWSHERSGVALAASPVSGETLTWFWTGIGNVIRMNEIVAYDLKALYPDRAAAIDANLQSVKGELISLKGDLELRLLDVPDPLVYALTDELANMTNELGIFVEGTFVKQDIDWTGEDYANLTAHLKAVGIPVVIHKWDPSDEIRSAVEAGGARLVVLDNLELTDQPLVEGLRANGEALLAGFGQGN